MTRMLKLPFLVRVIAAFVFLLTGSIGVEASAQTATTSNVAIQTTEDGESVIDVCYELVGYSETECDGNKDGQVTFLNVPSGQYTVHQTTDLGSERNVADFEIDVSGAGLTRGWITFEAEITKSAPEGDNGEVTDVALITRAPKDGKLLNGACYQLLDQANVTCDKDNDGQVEFPGVPFGTHTVRQTMAPEGHDLIDDFEITVQSTGTMEGPPITVPLGFVVKQAKKQNAPESRHVSMIFIDGATHEKITIDACAEIEGTSKSACDDDLKDGQIDFLDVPAGGPYELNFDLPDGRQVMTVGGPLMITIGDKPNSPTTELVFVLVSGTQETTVAPTSAPETNDVAASNATLLMTFRGCPEGFRPGIDDYATMCTIPLDAPDASFLIDLRQTSASIPLLPRQNDGTYVYTAGSPQATFILDGLDPVLRDGYTVVGHDSIDEINRHWVNFSNGENRQIYVYYYYSPGASQPPIQQTSNSGNATVVMTFRGCPEGFDPNVDDFYANCTIPLDAPDASFLYHGGDGQGGMNIIYLDRQYDGSYLFNAGPNTMNLTLGGLAPVLRDGYTVHGADGVSGDEFTLYLVDGETRQIFVFYYYWP